MLLTNDLHEYFIYVESVTIALVIAAKSLDEFGAELRAPKPDSLIAHRNTTPGQQIFDISMTQIESVVEPNSVANYGRRESMALVRCSSPDHPSVAVNLSVPLRVHTVAHRILQVPGHLQALLDNLAEFV